MKFSLFILAFALSTPIISQVDIQKDKKEDNPWLISMQYISEGRFTNSFGIGLGKRFSIAQNVSIEGKLTYLRESYNYDIIGRGNWKTNSIVTDLGALYRFGPKKAGYVKPYVFLKHSFNAEGDTEINPVKQFDYGFGLNYGHEFRINSNHFIGIELGLRASDINGLGGNIGVNFGF